MHDLRNGAAMLVLSIRAGDAVAEAELVARYRPQLTRLLERQTHDRTSAEDLAQDALLVALVHLRRGKLRQPAALPSFLRSIATNLVRAEWRRRRRRRTDALSDLIDLLDEAADPLDTMLAAEELETLRLAIDSLASARDREVLRRTYVAGESRESVRDALGLSELRFNTVLHRARQRLRRAIENFTTSLT